MQCFLYNIVFCSTGSGEEDELDTGIDSFVIIESIEAPPPSVSADDGLREMASTTSSSAPPPPPAGSSVVPSGEPEQGEGQTSPPQAPVKKEEKELGAQSSEQLQELVNEQQRQGKDGVASLGTSGGGETPPTPQASEPSTTQNETAADSGCIQSGEECDKDKATDDEDGSQKPKNGQEAGEGEGERIEQASGIGGEEGEKRQDREAVSPPASGSLGQQTGLIGINEVGTA